MKIKGNMFFGTTPQIISQYIIGEMRRLKPKRIIVPFAGNFVIEQLAGLYDKSVEIHSTDIMLYSRAIGFAAMNKKFDIKYKPELLETYPFYNDKTSPIDYAVAVIYFNEISKFSKKLNIPYYHNLNEFAKTTIQSDYDRIRQKIETFINRLPDKFTFHGIDACELLKEVKEDDFVFYDPPVILGDYEKQYSPLESIFEFDTPFYKQMTDELKMEQLNDLSGVGAIVYYRTNNPNPDINYPYEQVFQYQYKYNASYCVYSNVLADKFVGSFTPLREKALNLPYISKEDIITENSEVEFIKVQSLVGNHYRMLWVKKAEMTDTGHSYLVLIDKKLIGVVCLSDAVKFGSEWSLKVSDPACPFSRYKRLSKLILHLICTETTLNMINDVSLWEHKGFTTRVFTNYEVSMKYRSLFNLTEKSKDTGNFKYKLIYKSKKLFKDYNSALKEWLKKDGKILE